MIPPPDQPPPALDRATEIRLRGLEEEVRGLRRALLRTVALAAAALLGAGLVVPVVTETIDSEELTLRTGTAWYSTLVDPGTDGEGAVGVLGVGFVGLLLVALATLWILVVEVAGHGGPSRRQGLRLTAVGLTAVGSLVPVLFSVAASGSGSEEAGWGGVLLLAGAVLAGMVITREDSRDLWLRGPR